MIYFNVSILRCKALINKNEIKTKSIFIKMLVFILYVWVCWKYVFMKTKKKNNNKNKSVTFRNNSYLSFKRVLNKK